MQRHCVGAGRIAPGRHCRVCQCNRPGKPTDGLHLCRHLTFDTAPTSVDGWRHNVCIATPAPACSPCSHYKCSQSGSLTRVFTRSISCRFHVSVYTQKLRLGSSAVHAPLEKCCERRPQWSARQAVWVGCPAPPAARGGLVLQDAASSGGRRQSLSGCIRALLVRTPACSRRTGTGWARVAATKHGWLMRSCTLL